MLPGRPRDPLTSVPTMPWPELSVAELSRGLVKCIPAASPAVCVLAIVTVMKDDVVRLPAASRARAASVCVPFDAVVVFQEML